MADEGGPIEECPKCPECPPGLPGWMATFSDLVTLLLTFFVLLLSFAKSETSKYEAALGSIRNAFGGNVFKHGKVIQTGKSADNQPTMVESQTPIRPFPIDFLTMEGMLDKHEINRESAEDINTMKRDLEDYGLSDAVNVYETKEGVKVNLKDKILFKKGETEISKISVEIFKKIVKLLSSKNWTIFVKGHSSVGEFSNDGKMDALALSAKRASDVSKALMARGIRANKLTIVFYGDSRPVKIAGQKQDELDRLSRRVEFTIRKSDLETEGHKVDAK